MDAGIAERLKRFRQALNLDQDEMAQRIDTPLRTYQNYEQGRSGPKPGALFSLAALGCNIHWLVTGDGQMLAVDEPMPSVPQPQPPAPQVDGQLMGRVVDAIKALYKAQAVGIADIQVGRLAADWYNQIVAADPDDAVGQGMALAAKIEEHRAQLRRDTADPAHAKRPA